MGTFHVVNTSYRSSPVTKSTLLTRHLIVTAARKVIFATVRYADTLSRLLFETWYIARWVQYRILRERMRSVSITQLVWPQICVAYMFCGNLNTMIAPRGVHRDTPLRVFYAIFTAQRGKSSHSARMYVDMAGLQLRSYHRTTSLGRSRRA